MVLLQVKNRDIIFRDFQNCNIIIYGVLLVLFMNKLKDCIVLCGLVFGVVFIEDCFSCKFVFLCYQLRVYSIIDSKFYFYVISRVIVEDCFNLGFVLFNWKYENLRSDFVLVGFDFLENNWLLVNDFNWLKVDEFFFNWFIISED